MTLPPPSRRLSLRLVLGLAAAIAFDSALQLTWKTAVLDVPDEATMLGTLQSVFSNPLFVAVIAIMTFQFFNWLVVLANADLSYAKPIASLSYAIVPALSVVVLHETLDTFEVAGIACVIAGVWFISRTKPVTSVAGDRTP